MYPKSLENLIEKFRMLPGVGEKTAERYALFVVDENMIDVQEFAHSLMSVKENLKHCHICGNLSENHICDICSDEKRNKNLIFVVQSAKDVLAMEKTNEFEGVYHILNGLISAGKGIMPNDLNIENLLKRAVDADEIILATNTTIDGETTAMYLAKLLKSKYPNILVTRIAHGLPSGGMLDYADEMTLTHALTGRKKMD